MAGASPGAEPMGSPAPLVAPMPTATSVTIAGSSSSSSTGLSESTRFQPGSFARSPTISSSSLTATVKGWLNTAFSTPLREITKAVM